MFIPHPEILDKVIEAVVESAAGKAVGKAFSIFSIKRKPREKKINLTGTWIAVWQTTENKRQRFSRETLEIKQKGKKVTIKNNDKSTENRNGAYLWSSECKLYDNRHICGAYLAEEKNVFSKGVLFFCINPNGKVLEGKWIGCNTDFPGMTWGFGVIAKDFRTAERHLRKLIETGKDNGNISSSTNNRRQ